MEERSAVAVFGLPGFGLLDVTEVDGEREYVIETVPTLVGCPTCGSLARAKGRHETVLGDLAQGEWPVRLRAPLARLERLKVPPCWERRT